MLDLGAAERADSAIDPAEHLVDVLSAHVDENSAPARAAAEVRRRMEAGETPVGLYRLSEVLTAPNDGTRKPVRVDEPGAVVEVIRRFPCAVLEAASARAIADNVAAVLADGKRVLVTGSDPGALALVRGALPESVRGLCLDAPLPLSPAELRELRALQMTVGANAGANGGAAGRTGAAGGTQASDKLPDPAVVPTAERVTALCRAARNGAHAEDELAERLRGVLANQEPARLSGLLQVARHCRDAMAAMDRGDPDPPWGRPLLDRVLFDAARPELDALVSRTSELVRAGDSLREVAGQLAVAETLDAQAVQRLRDYADYLDSGGRSRHYFRSARQRAVEPVLRQITLDGVPLKNTKDSRLIRQALTFAELVTGMRDLAERCARLGVPQPADIPQVAALGRQLARIQNAATAVENLRREVLFLGTESPIMVLDVATAEKLALVIADFNPAEMAEARRELTELADQLAASSARTGAASQVNELVRALRAADLPNYLNALTRLSGAWRARADERRRGELLDRLREAAPELARIWTEPETRHYAHASVRFVATDELLRQLPEADSVDLVLLLDAEKLDAANLLAAAAAPRLLAVGPRLAERATAAPSADSVLAMLRLADVPVVVAGGAELGPTEAANQAPETSMEPAVSVPWIPPQRAEPRSAKKPANSDHREKRERPERRGRHRKPEPNDAAEKPAPPRTEAAAPTAERGGRRHEMAPIRPPVRPEARMPAEDRTEPTEPSEPTEQAEQTTQPLRSVEADRPVASVPAQRTAPPAEPSRTDQDAAERRFAVLPLGIVPLDDE